MARKKAVSRSEDKHRRHTDEFKIEHGDSLIHNPQSGQESIDLEDVRTSSGSDVFKS